MKMTTATYVSTETRPDGSTSHDETKLKRTPGTSGLVGTWESTAIKVGAPNAIEIAVWNKDGYSINNPIFKGETNFKLDGKEYMPRGPRVAKGTTISGKKTGDRTMELTYKLNGKTTEIDRWELSADGKTLTNTINYPGVDKQEVDVYDRE